MTRTILFVCPHNAAKSVMAASLCAREAAARGLGIQVDSAGTEPDAEPAPAVVALLAAQGIDVSDHLPRRVNGDNLSGAWRVVSMGCDLTGITPARIPVEHWDDIPAPSANLDGAHRSIRKRVDALVDEALRGDQGASEQVWAE